MTFAEISIRITIKRMEVTPLVGPEISARLTLVIYDASLDELLQKVWDGGRINAAEALRLYHLPLEELGALADRRRRLAKATAYNHRGNEIVTYNVDRNVNYTNICNVYCKFCAFYRTEKDDDSYVITFDEMDRKIEETIALGGTQMLMQGGHHPKLTKQWYLDLLAHVKDKFPGFNIHGFSPSEFVHFREVFNEPLEKIIGDFKAAGLGSIPGGGGEILVDRVRQRIAPLKAMSNDWLEVMDVAHRLGLYSSATMMFGHVETIEDRIEHLERLREQQEISLKRVAEFHGAGIPPGHFTAFIGWTFQAEHTKLKAPTVGAHEYLRTQALARPMKGQRFVLDTVRAMYEWAADPERGRLLPEGFRNPFLRMAGARTLLKADTILIDIDFNSGRCEATAWGCDLSKKYVEINTEYPT